MNEDLKLAINIIGFVIIFLTIIGIPIAVLEYYSSCREAKVFNAKYETNYTCGDFFWAEDQINAQIQTIKIEGL